jgi:phospholipase/lecithinase/hemolysin
MTEVPTPVISANEQTYTQLRQVTIAQDEQISDVNQLLAEGWRLVSIGYRPDATVYVLGRMDEKPRHRTGFLAAE